MTLPTLLSLTAIVALAFTVESAVGFGATVVTVALGSLLLPVDAVLPAFVPVNLVLSAVLAARNHRHVAARLLATRLLPWLLLGLPVGFFGGRHVDERTLKLVFGAFVLVLSALELSRARAVHASEASATPPRELPLWRARGLLVAGGLIHGAFATGGPMVVYVLGRQLGEDKARFRATLSVLWLILNALLVAGYVQAGRVDASSLRASAAFLVALVVGLGVGEIAHRRIPARRFVTTVFALLGLVGAVIVLRALRVF